MNLELREVIENNYSNDWIVLSSKDEITLYPETRFQEGHYGFKPKGLWLGKGTDWLDFIEEQGMDSFISSYCSAFKVYLGNDILVLKDFEDYHSFTLRYGVSKGKIDWKKVAKRYNGIIAYDPIRFQFNEELEWVYGWDITSACIWSADGIEDVEKVYDNCEDELFKKGGKVTTWKHKYNKKYGYPKDKSHSLKEISKDTGISMKGIQEIYNKGIGAYKTNPSSVRPNVKSKEQWAYARVYSAVMGGKASKVDAKELKMKMGGKIDYKAQEYIDMLDALNYDPNNPKKQRLKKYADLLLNEYGIEYVPESIRYAKENEVLDKYVGQRYVTTNKGLELVLDIYKRDIERTLGIDAYHNGNYVGGLGFDIDLELGQLRVGGAKVEDKYQRKGVYRAMVDILVEIAKENNLKFYRYGRSDMAQAFWKNYDPTEELQFEIGGQVCTYDFEGYEVYKRKCGENVAQYLIPAEYDRVSIWLFENEFPLWMYYNYLARITASAENILTFKTQFQKEFDLEDYNVDLYIEPESNNKFWKNKRNDGKARSHMSYSENGSGKIRSLSITLVSGGEWTKRFKERTSGLNIPHPVNGVLLNTAIHEFAHLLDVIRYNQKNPNEKIIVTHQRVFNRIERYSNQM